MCHDSIIYKFAIDHDLNLAADSALLNSVIKYNNKMCHLQMSIDLLYLWL